MDKEFLKMMSELFANMSKNLDGDLDKKIDKAMKRVFNEETEIQIIKSKNGKTEIKTKGTNLSILITLAGLEKSILDRLGLPKRVFDFLKDTVGTMEVGDE